MTTAARLRPVRVLLAEHLTAERDRLAYLLNADPGLQVVGVAMDGEQAVTAARRSRPDLILMNVRLPKLDSFSAARKIMETCPTRILMMSAASTPPEVAQTFQALESGALAVVPVPSPVGHPDYQPAARELLRTVKLMAEVPVVKRWKREAKDPQNETPKTPPACSTRRIDVVAIGASTGGPLVLQTILSRLPADFSAPILIVQHIAIGFTAGLNEWLHRTSGYPVRIAAHGDAAMPGRAYLAPDGMHMLIRTDRVIVLSDGAPEHGMRPSASCLFRSVATGFGSCAAGVLLTGMGRDGAHELKMMRQAGAVTMVQDRASSVVYGMPGEALRLDAADHVLAPEDIAAMLVRLAMRNAA